MERIRMRLSPPQQAFVAPCSFCTAAFLPVLELGKSSGVFGEAAQLLLPSTMVTLPWQKEVLNTGSC